MLFARWFLFQYPRPGSWALGFYTGDSNRLIKDISEDESINVFLPTTPNPTSGFLLFVPRKEARMLTMSVEEGIKMVVSGGIVTPEYHAPEQEQEKLSLQTTNMDKATNTDQPTNLGKKPVGDNNDAESQKAAS